MKKQFIKIPLLTLALLSLGIYSCTDKKDGKESAHVEESVDKHDDHDAHDHAGLIKLDDHRAKEFGVAAEKIDASDFSEAILVSGKIESKSIDEGVATATKSGIITLSPNINTGVMVSGGTSIGSIRPSSVEGGNPSIQAAAARDAAKRELDRLAPLHKEGVVSTQKYNEALSAYEQAEASLKSTRQGSTSVATPKSGVITQLLVKTGDFVEAGQRIAIVSGNTNLTLRADVPEKYISKVSGIETANFRPASAEDTYSLKDLNGKLLSSGGTAVTENGYLPIYFTFDNNGEIAPGSFAEVYLISGKRQGVVSLPKEAIVEINGNKCVYTKHGEGMYEKHVVTTGASDGQRIEIISGLKAGEDVVTKGAQIVRMAETSATAVPGHTHNH